MKTFRPIEALTAFALAVSLAACGSSGGGDAPAQAAAGSGIDNAADPSVLIESSLKAPAPVVGPVAPLNIIGVPDVNVLGLLDGAGPNAGNWPKITKTGQRTELQRLGKALFWDMQVGGDGIQSCASCHFHAGADNRKTNQLSPGFKAIQNPDLVVDIAVGVNGTLAQAHFSAISGFPASEAARLAAGNSADAADGTSGVNGAGKPASSVDVNDVASSQGVRGGTQIGVHANRVDVATLSSDDPGFNKTFGSAAFKTVRRVEPRNSPTVINAVYNLRNFWDGRADSFFNGVNPLGFRDPDAKIWVWTGAAGQERLNIPFSSLASQAVGPIGSDFEMVFSGRSHRDLGVKLTGLQPMAGQQIAATDSLLSADSGWRSDNGIGLKVGYAQKIKQIFDNRFWGTAGGADIFVCLDVGGNVTGLSATASPSCSVTLLQHNFGLFFGLAVQAYEATLFSEQTIVDLLAGGIATGTITNGRNVVNTAGLAFDGCLAAVPINNSAAQAAIAQNLCTAHYAKFIHPLARTGTESATAPNPVPNNSAIGGCGVNASPTQPCAAFTGAAGAAQLARAQATLLNVNRGLGRWFAGATGCSVCHFNPEFTGATVSTLTGFGAGPPGPLPPGQLRRVELRAMMERMIAFNGAAAVYDSGFYNLGVRPTPEDISLGDSIGGVPLALTKLMDIIGGGAAPNPPFDPAKITRIKDSIPALRIPTAPNNLTPIPFPLVVGCGVGLVGNGNANNNPNIGCITNVIPGERLLRNGAFKAPSIRNVRFTGPYFHNGSAMNLRQVLEFYKSSGHFPGLNLNNLDAGMRQFALGAADESAVIELMETGLTDWRVAFQQGPFDHPEICVPHGHDEATGKTRLVKIPAVGATGDTQMLQTFQQQLSGQNGFANNLQAACTMVGVADGDGLSLIDQPPSVFSLAP